MRFHLVFIVVLYSWNKMLSRGLYRRLMTGCNVSFLLNKTKNKRANSHFGVAQNTCKVHVHESGAWCETIFVTNWFTCTSHKTAGEQLAHTRCIDFDKPSLYHPLIHPPRDYVLSNQDCLNCLGHFWIFHLGRDFKTSTTGFFFFAIAV